MIGGRLMLVFVILLLSYAVGECLGYGWNGDVGWLTMKGRFGCWSC